MRGAAVLLVSRQRAMMSFAQSGCTRVLVDNQSQTAPLWLEDELTVECQIGKLLCPELPVVAFGLDVPKDQRIYIRFRRYQQ